MGWQKPGDALVLRFDQSLPQDSRVERRKMFGCPCAFVGGNMFAGVHEQNLILRLPPDRREGLLAAQAAQAFTVMGRTMREYVAVGAAWEKDEAEIAGLVAEAFGYAASLPAKAPKPRRRGAAGKD